jgi:hypothetical protein
MSFLARKVKGPLWAHAGEAGQWVRPEFPFELLGDLIDKHGGGISVWEIKSKVDPALKRIAAALTVEPSANSSKAIQSMEFRLIDKAKAQSLGINVTASDGGTKDAGINGLHRELSKLTSTQAIGLLRLMNKRARVFSAKDVAKSVADGLLRGRLPPEILSSQLMWSLHQYDAIKIVVPKT